MNTNLVRIEKNGVQRIIENVHLKSYEDDGWKQVPVKVAKTPKTQTQKGQNSNG